MATNSKTTRNLSQFAEKKLVGRAHTRADRSDVSEGIPSNIQLTTTTIFGESVPSVPADNAGSIALWDTDSNDRVQKVELTVTAISGTSYDADASEDLGGSDTQGTGTHAYSLSLTSNYETQAGNNNPKKGTGVFTNGKRLYDTLGALQIVPTNLWIDPTFVTPNPYDVKIYYNNSGGVSQGFLGPTDNIDWFIDPYAGIVFLQEFDPNKIPYKVECFIYVGDMASTTAGASALNDLSDVNVPSPSNNQVLKYNASASKWEASTESGGGGIERYSYIHSGSSISADTDITVTGMNFTGLSPSNADTKVYLNGQLLLGGSVSDVTSNTVDYAFNNNTQIRFICPIDDGDQVAIYYTTTSFSNGKDILLHTDDAAFNNARVITAGDGISISKATPRQLIISNTGLIQRSKTHITSTGTYTTNDTFTVTGVDFSSKSYSDDRIDIFLNGTLLIKGVGYQLKDQVSTLQSSQFKLIGSTSIGSGDVLTAILF
jgi:hypothetical protein